MTQVHTLRFGNPTYLKSCVPTLERWCRTHGHELVVHGLEDPDKYPSPKFMEIDAIREFLDSDADTFAWIDADVFIHAQAPRGPSFTGIAMATCQRHAEHQNHWEGWCEEHFKVRPSGHPYSNAGVYFLDRDGAAAILKHAKPPFIETFQEQHQFNLWVWLARQDGVPFTTLPDKWNRYGRDMEPSWFFHLWGETKDEDLESLRRAKLLDLWPDTLIHNWHPETWPSSDKMICLEFVQDAGLGNQMFEWSAAYSIARTMHLPLRWVWRPSKLRDFGLGAFGIGVGPYTEYPLLVHRAGQGSRRLRDLAIQRITESKERFCGISCPFQDEQCFIDHADEIREMFRLQPMSLVIPPDTTPVGVQVRRGDYVKHSRLSVTTPEYFHGAMDWMKQQIPNAFFVVVSDDPHYCRTIFEKRFDVLVMPSQTAIDGLRTLASCEAHIISNSTFGWWGAWLGEKGPVVVPEIWHHKPGSYGDWNPVPARWVKLPVGTAKPEPPAIVARVVAELPAPGVERAIVYPWHADAAQWEELRYSLRSIDQFFEDKHCPIYIYGTRRPSFLKEGTRVQYRGAFTYQEALAGGVQAAESVLWMNDDIMLLRPTGWADFATPKYLRDVSPEFIDRAGKQTNPWRAGCLKVLARLREMGITDQKVFSTHTPYLWEREKALKVFEEFGIWEKFPMELAYFHLFGLEEAAPIGDEVARSLPAPEEARFLSFTDHLLTVNLKEWIEATFRNRPTWEIG